MPIIGKLSYFRRIKNFLFYFEPIVTSHHFTVKFCIRIGEEESRVVEKFIEYFESLKYFKKAIKLLRPFLRILE